MGYLEIPLLTQLGCLTDSHGGQTSPAQAGGWLGLEIELTALLTLT